MKVKRQNVCDTCRTRKLGCDGKQPSCTQCLHSGRKCAGYKHDMIFVSQYAASADLARKSNVAKAGLAKRDPTTSTKTSKGVQLRVTKADASSTLTPRSLMPSQSTLEASMTWIISQYLPEEELACLSWDSTTSQSRICGSWVKALPQLTGQGRYQHVLSSCIAVLGLSISNFTNEGKRSSTSCIQAYGIAIHLVRRALEIATAPFSIELASAIMCLSLTEVMIPTSETGFEIHLRAIRELIRIPGPSCYRSGISHMLFVGYRPLLILGAALERKSTFLASLEWKSKPFEAHKPSPMQVLLGEASVLPSIQEKVDILLDTASIPFSSTVQEVWNSLIDFYLGLEKWEQSFSMNSERSLYWPKPKQTTITPTDYTSRAGQTSLWFPDIMTANVYTTLWAFQIICLAEMEKLEPYIGQYSSVLQPPILQNLASKPIELSILICQSMEYLIQPNMKLFGPASTIFPLKVAFDQFKKSGTTSEHELYWCHKIIDQLIFKGVHIAPFRVATR